MANESLGIDSHKTRIKVSPIKRIKFHTSSLVIGTTCPNVVDIDLYFSWRKNISYFACATQLFFFLTLGIAECVLLTLMAYDRYVAVCIPLRYTVLMSPTVCLQMAAAAWIGGALTAIGHTIYPMHLPSCGSKKINHFFCEVPAILRLSCVDTTAYEMVKFVTTIVFLLVPFFLILLSYTFIFLTVFRMNSRKGKNKALATCSSHLTVVSLYFGQAIFIYMMPSSSHTPEQEQIVAVFGTMVTPMLNPLIYSLRNKEVVGALKKVAIPYATSKYDKSLEEENRIGKSRQPPPSACPHALIMHMIRRNQEPPPPAVLQEGAGTRTLVTSVAWPLLCTICATTAVKMAAQTEAQRFKDVLLLKQKPREVQIHTTEGLGTCFKTSDFTMKILASLLA
ncbi:PREDICTED: olfactory receptor 2AG2-like [Chrysochloris asiatica]|uniref:Olfactory receptor n=1 Tax=Chrysochloris asiatica TaxID=185453 RepID=A0A9B0U027_CHRAS|nr:PREDICTED: olfactory receptor 2AG2-like [Chrysochloris asiatica]